MDGDRSAGLKFTLNIRSGSIIYQGSTIHSFPLSTMISAGLVHKSKPAALEMQFCFPHSSLFCKWVDSPSHEKLLLQQGTGWKVNSAYTFSIAQLPWLSSQNCLKESANTQAYALWQMLQHMHGMTGLHMMISCEITSHIWMHYVLNSAYTVLS